MMKKSKMPPITWKRNKMHFTILWYYSALGIFLRQSHDNNRNSPWTCFSGQQWWLVPSQWSSRQICRLTVPVVQNDHSDSKGTSLHRWTQKQSTADQLKMPQKCDGRTRSKEANTGVSKLSGMTCWSRVLEEILWTLAETGTHSSEWPDLYSCSKIV